MIVRVCIDPGWLDAGHQLHRGPVKLRLVPHSYNGGPLALDEFAFTQSPNSAEPDGVVFHCRGTAPNPARPRICRVAIVRGAPQAPIHGWDGNREAPTITPSIGCESRGCSWHGHINAGEWTP